MFNINNYYIINNIRKVTKYSLNRLLVSVEKFRIGASLRKKKPFKSS